MKIKLNDYPLVARDTPFLNDLYTFWEGSINMNRAEYNLICSKRDISLYVKCDMKPHRNWRVTDVKKYFGIKGTGQKLLDEFMLVYNQYEELNNLIHSTSNVILV
ncbi:MAG: hypothetical protein Unbinned1473contig1000_32 [Prokaryotic dsDNA virus sp.]|nr:MAG: hypothetical protein Unbinned1473contig1000_32 [Prokaryotic dsDNA virus sp.]|tara:strand:+ start:972 stop:1286 length:315 start_codon:yes stop_codon:yes gene_type:complete